MVGSFMLDCDIEQLAISSSAIFIATRGMMKEKGTAVIQRQGDNHDQNTISASLRPLRTAQKRPSTHEGGRANTPPRRSSVRN
jgi:hypothetical protein